MKVSEIAIEDICRQIREEVEYLTEDDKIHLSILKKAAIEHVKGYTGLNGDEIDKHEDITIAVLVLISDMYDNRQLNTGSEKVNMVIQSIVGMHARNIL